MFRRVLKQGCFGLTWTPEKLEHSDFWDPGMTLTATNEVPAVCYLLHLMEQQAGIWWETPGGGWGLVETKAAQG